MRLFNRPLRISATQRVISKFITHLLILSYLGGLFVLATLDKLGGDPVKVLLHDTGVASLVLLLLTLSISPLAKYLPCGDLMRYRRLFGVYAFVAACVHLSTYFAFDIQLDTALLIEDIVKRPYITVGFIAFVILFSLAVTSPNRIRRLLGKRWQALHNTVYAGLVLALLHFTWSVKTVFQDPLYYWIAGLLLLAYRFSLRLKKKQIMKKNT